MAQRTYLQLCSQLANDAGVTKAALVTVTGHQGQLRRVVDAVARAWKDIQEAHRNWRFLRKTATWTTTAGKALYTPVECGLAAGELGAWIDDTFRIYLTASGFNNETFLPFREWESYRNIYQFNSYRSQQSRPTEMTVSPLNEIGLGSPPTAGYTVLGDYFRSAIALVADADVPALPDQHSDDIILFKAMRDYAQHEAAPELYEWGNSEYGTRLAQLEADQLPQLRWV